jgi:hypothetical protein
MVKVTYNKPLTEILVFDPYNDFISEGGKAWDRGRPLQRRIVVFLICYRF